MVTLAQFKVGIAKRSAILRRAGIIEEPLLRIPFGRGAWSEEVQVGMKGSRSVKPKKVLFDVEED